MENNQYISLANKYRPQTFEDMVGQESISKTLQNALKLGRIGHAYLFYGPRGCGKTTTARILAKALNCTGNGNTKPTPHPCGKCSQCIDIAQSADIDVLELDAASNTQVDKVREEIIDKVGLAASRDRYKVFILDEVHMLSASSFNALLKTIEEPPSHVVFILATTEKHKVPATIVSRCQTFRFRPLTVTEISEHLLELAEAENIDLTPSAAKIIAKNAGGAMRDALTLLDRAIAYAGSRIDEKLIGEMLGLTPEDLLQQAITALIQKDNASLHQVFETLQNEGFDANSFLKDLKNTVGDLFYFSLKQGTAPFTEAATLIASVSTGFLAQLSRKLNKLIEEVKFSDSALISAEVGLFTIMDSILDLEGFIRRLEALEKGEVSSSAQPPSVTHTPLQKPVARPAAASPAQKKPSVTEISAPKTEEPTLKKLEGVISNKQIWDKMLTHFRPSPFIYDVMTTGTVHFTEENVWTLTFPEGKEFYQITAKNRLDELSKAASAFGGRSIRVVVAESAKTAVGTPLKSEPKKLVISEEKPLVSPVVIAEEKTVSPSKTPQEVKDILDIFPGEFLA